MTSISLFIPSSHGEEGSHKKKITKMLDSDKQITVSGSQPCQS